jgi:4-amino-4-deoxy-L-arabinose transferase-like glycosyltransferase
MKNNFNISRIPYWGWLLAALLALGALLRAVNLSAPPLDFQSVRQMRNMIVARAFYYEMLPDPDPTKLALAKSFYNAVGQYEPPMTETLVAWTYTWTGGEHVAVPRIYESLFWLLAGLALFDLARRISSPAAALMALAYYLVLPFAVQASRSFQPDPLMTSAFITGLYFLFRWSQTVQPAALAAAGGSWKWAVLAGLFLGFAVLVKIVIVFLVIGAAVAAVLSRLGWRFWRSPQMWVMAALMAIPAFAYYVLGHPGRSDEYFFAWTIDLLHLITTTSFYGHWLGFISSLFGFTALFLSLGGILLAPAPARWMLMGAWIGYLFYGLTLPFQMFTHSYYHIQLIPIIALGLAPILKLAADRLSGEGRWLKAAAVALVVFVIGYQGWVARSAIVAQDFSGEPAYWQMVARVIPPNSSIVALTQDYGYRLMYYGWRKLTLWPYENGLKNALGTRVNVQASFGDLATGKDYFLVTAGGQLAQQPALAKILDGYQIAAQGEGFILYDLHKPK